MPALRALALVLLLLLPGCAASSYTRLASEDDIPRFAALKQAAQRLDQRTTLVPTGHPGEHPLHIAIHEVGHSRGSVIILIHGIFSDSHAWRFITADLAREHDLMLIDLPGCGQSDAPAPDLIGREEYSPPAMARRLLQAIESRLAARPGPPPRLAIVAHSLGGTTAMRMFCDQAERYPGILGRIDRMTLFAPLDVAAAKPDPLFRRLATTPDLTFTFGESFGMIRERCARGTLESVCDPSFALREEADKRAEILTTRERRRALQAMLLESIPRTADLRPDWERIDRLTACYARISAPTLIVWGQRDEALPASMGYKLAHEIPGATLLLLPDVMHSPHIEAPELAAAVILGFLDAGPDSN